MFLAVAVAAAPAGGSAAAAPCQRTIAISPQVTAGESAGTLTFEVRSVGCPAAGEVGYTVTAGSALPAADFTLSRGALRWDAGDTSVRSIVATIADDPVREDALEDFTVTLTAPSDGIVVLRGTGDGRILDDDGSTLFWAADDAFIMLGQGYMLGHGYCVTPPPPPPDPPLTVVWRTEDGTAQAGVDYVAVTDRTQIVPAGAMPVALGLTLLEPRTVRPTNLWFTVRIVGVSSGAVADAVAIVTIDRP